jgi:osmoprotectant transport system permease protein
MRNLLSFWLANRAEFLVRLGEHIVLVGVAGFVVVALGVPLGIIAARRPRLGAPIVTLANAVQTIPSLALFGFLIPIPLLGGLGARTAIVALILYGLLPVIRTTVAGLTSIDRAIVEAGTALGMTPRQLLFKVELPLALPSIVAGIKVAIVVGVGTATIAAAIGAGGLGEYIFRGLSMVDSTVILAGAIPAALLALLADAALTWLERRLSVREGGVRRSSVVTLTVVALVAVVVGGAVLASASRPAVVVGSKNFTEQLILGELMAQAIERSTHLQVDRRLNLGGTLICNRAIRAGEIDLYVEYTGTALTAIFNRPIETHDRGAVLQQVKQAYAEAGLTLIDSLGFNNTFAILIRGDAARTLGLQTISEAARYTPAWRPGFGYEFMERPDGFRGLASTYSLRFAAAPRVMDLALTYRALAERQVDLIAGDATNGLIQTLDLFMLRDDRSYFPPYDAAPVIRTSTLLRFPEIRPALQQLSGRINEADMRRLNYAVDGQHRPVQEVVAEFLNRLGTDK